MRITSVIPSRQWEHVSGRRASIYGSLPWTSEADKANWTMVTSGWTWELDNGTIGLGRVPAKTKEEAEALMHKFNNRDY
jgi:hypothetical protein